MRRLYKGKPVSTWEDLRPYTGKAARDVIVGEERRKAYMLNYDQLRINYGENVEFQLRREQVILCPQTADFLYTKFTPTKVSYQRGSRPVLEKVVKDVTDGCTGESEKALALMRFCRDLYKKDRTRDFSRYVYGGTEEQLIEKGEQLCECLGRLFVALCEVAGIPGRIVMHDIGGHIAAEVCIGGRWAYIDPRAGFYCLKPDGSFASTWEIWLNPGLLRSQSDRVKSDVSDRFTWEERVWKCEKKYFHIKEVNGFENYSLKDSSKYGYAQVSSKEAADAGLFVINKEYRKTSDRVFGLGQDASESWGMTKLKKVALAFRNDGFSVYFRKPPMTRATLQEEYIDPLAETNLKFLGWGVGPGSVFCYDTKIGDVFGRSITEKQWRLFRTGDRWVYENLKGLIESGTDPLDFAVRRGHEIGLKVYARFQMNHEYGPADPDNYLWVGLVGRLNKEHPEYRIGRGVQLDFKHKEVRDFKLAILREVAEKGVDAVMLDFTVYPPFFEKPDAEIMTQFVRDVRTMLNEVGAGRNRHIDLIVELPFRGYLELGLDWKRWMEERLIDIIVPTRRRAGDVFDIRVDEFVEMGRKNGCKVWGFVFHSLGYVTTDPMPQDEKTGVRRYSKPKTLGMYFAQALIYHRSGVDGIEIAGSSGLEWRRRPWYSDLADPKKVEYADKHYMVDPIPFIPVTFRLPEKAPFMAESEVELRIADDIPQARAEGHSVDATLIFYARGLKEGEELSIYVNDNGPLVVSGDSPEEKSKAAPIDWRKKAPSWRASADGTFIADPKWWKRGEHKLPFDAGWLRLGTNKIRLAYSTKSRDVDPPFRTSWIDLILEYDKKK